MVKKSNINFYVVVNFENTRKKLKLAYVLVVAAPVLQFKGLYSDA